MKSKTVAKSKLHSCAYRYLSLSSWHGSAFENLHMCLPDKTELAESYAVFTYVLEPSSRRVTVASLSKKYRVNM